MARSVKHPTLDFCSCHDLTVHGIEPCVRFCADSVEPAWDSLSPYTSSPLSLSLSLSKINYFDYPESFAHPYTYILASVCLSLKKKKNPCWDFIRDYIKSIDQS